MNDKSVTYEWSWTCLSLFKNTKDCGSGSSLRVFSLKPAWVWKYWQNVVMVWLGCWPPDPFWVCEKWLRKNHLWDREGDAFFKAVDRYAASCDPGEYLRLQPGLLR